MFVFRIEDESGQWLQDMELGVPNWKPGDRIHRGRDSLEVIAVRGDTLVVRGHVPQGD